MSALITPPQGLSVRTPNELLKMSFPASDIYVGDGIIAKGQCGALIGPGGVGKSTLSMQLAISLALGTPFLGLTVETSEKKCLFLQTENSNRRLSEQVKKQLGCRTQLQQRQINKHLRIHTLEHDGDASLRLSTPENANAIARMVNAFAPDVLFVDPLNAFAKGSLTNADGMLDTLQALHRIARNANPDAAVIVVHHSLTTSKAFRDAVGPNRGSYGRDSKTLHGWSRGTFNIAPGDLENSRKIMVACGKNSNGEEFEPFGAVLNRDTMLYDRDPNFSLERWKSIVCGESGGRIALTPERVAEFVQDRHLTRAELVKEIMRETGCKKTTAYEAISTAENSTIVRNDAREYRAIKLDAA